VSDVKIAVIGATGRLGGAIARDAVDRGHDVTPLGSAEVDVTDPASIRRAVAGHDAVVASVKGPDRLAPRAARALLDAGAPRLVFVGGAGSLRTPTGERYVDTPGAPAGLRQSSLDQAEALEVFRAARTEVAWSYLSPPPVPLVDGPATGSYRAEARDTPLVAGRNDGEFRVADLAAAVVDALEQRSFVGQRFTLGR
jgi:putative NADH-flavin reductase